MIIGTLVDRLGEDSSWSDSCRHRKGPIVCRILLATTNQGKLREIRSKLGGLGLEFRTLRDFPGIEKAVEDGLTFEENARKKALHYARQTGLLTLADDSGLEVGALGGAPGIYSARFAGPEADDAANNAKLLSELADVPPEGRLARFRCVIALADSRRVLLTVEGTVEGMILVAPRGFNGFGYDPLFFILELGKTAAELDAETKNRVSHRGRALQTLAQRLPEILRGAEG